MFRNRPSPVVKPSRSSLLVRMLFILPVTLAVVVLLDKPSLRRSSLSRHGFHGEAVHVGECLIYGAESQLVIIDRDSEYGATEQACDDPV